MIGEILVNLCLEVFNLFVYLLTAMDLIDVIKSCTTVEEIEILEWVFDFDERHREAALWQRIILWANNMERGLEIERCGECPELLTSWRGKSANGFKMIGTTIHF